MEQQIKITQTSNADMNIGIPKKLTAIEWLIAQVNSEQYQIAFGRTYISIDLIEQAKQMEKEQIMKAVYDSMGTNFDPNWGRAVLYYYETYGDQTNN